MEIFVEKCREQIELMTDFELIETHQLYNELQSRGVRDEVFLGLLELELRNRNLEMA